jgi:hypothetical protein
MVNDQVDLPVRPAPYLIAHLHLARVWGRGLWEELEWFLMSMRGELPPRKKPARNYTVHHINLPEKQYFLALEALTTRLGVKL